MITLKIRLKKIFQLKKDYSFLYKIIDRMNNLTFICSHFIRSYILYEFENGRTIPKLDHEFIKSCYKILCKSSNGPKKKNNIDQVRKLNDFYFNQFCKLIYLNYTDANTLITEFKIENKKIKYKKHDSRI
jgi:hypothetical protein